MTFFADRLKLFVWKNVMFDYIFWGLKFRILLIRNSLMLNFHTVILLYENLLLRLISKKTKIYFTKTLINDLLLGATFYVLYTNASDTLKTPDQCWKKSS